jgi:hypothetical protein
MLKHKSCITGWWFQPSEKYDNQLGSFSQYMENKIHIPNHQPDNHLKSAGFVASLLWYPNLWAIIVSPHSQDQQLVPHCWEHGNGKPGIYRHIYI